MPRTPRRTLPAWRRFERYAPNDLWQIDDTQVALGDGSVAWVIDILDDHARFRHRRHRHHRWVLTNRMVAAVGSPIHSVQIVHLDHDSDDPNLTCAVTNDGRVALAPFLAENDIVVNCVLQDTDAPLTFLTEQDLGAFLPGSLIVDVSCDEGMGFSWARPTSFTAPSFVVGDNVHYYAVDHSPSYLWNSATWEISEALLPHLRTVLAGRAAWEADPTIGRAIEIRDGEILNPNVLSFQHRGDVYPHAVVSSGILH